MPPLQRRLFKPESPLVSSGSSPQPRRRLPDLKNPLLRPFVKRQAPGEDDRIDATPARLTRQMHEQIDRLADMMTEILATKIRTSAQRQHDQLLNSRDRTVRMDCRHRSSVTGVHRAEEGE